MKTIPRTPPHNNILGMYPNATQQNINSKHTHKIGFKDASLKTSATSNWVRHLERGVSNLSAMVTKINPAADLKHDDQRHIFPTFPKRNV